MLLIPVILKGLWSVSTALALDNNIIACHITHLAAQLLLGSFLHLQVIVNFITIIPLINNNNGSGFSKVHFLFVSQLGSFDLKCTRFYSAEVISALEHLHGLGVIHRCDAKQKLTKVVFLKLCLN